MKRKLGILLWKHMKERSRRICYDILEVLCGVMVFVVLVLAKMVLISDQEKHVDGFVKDIDLVDIAFTPQNDLTNMLMHRICSEELPETSQLFGSQIRCYALKDKNDANKFLQYNPRHTDADISVVIIFKNLNGTKFPAKLDYTMLYAGPNTYNVTKLQDLYRLHHPSASSTGDIEKMPTVFANVQWEIDKSYIENTTGEKVDHLVLFKEIKVGYTSLHMRVIHGFLVLGSFVGPLPFYMITHATLVVEKRSGIKALLSLSGIRPGIVRLAHLIDTAAYAAIYSIIVVCLLYSSNNPILKYSNAFIVWMTFILHFLTISSLAFLTSTSHSYQHSASTAILLYIMTFLINMFWGGRRFGEHFGLTLLYVILPHSPMFMFWKDVTALETSGEGVIFSNFFKGINPNDKNCTFAVWCLFLIQFAIISILSWYIDLVWPGDYGLSFPWKFIFRKRYWIRAFTKQKRGVNFHVTAEKKKKNFRDSRYFEEIKKGSKIIIKIVDLVKTYYTGFNYTKSLTSVDRVDLDVIKGEITVVVGTDGSGKSTLMSIVAGMCNATSGHVYVKGLDMESRLQDLRSDLGHCPQHNVTFGYLTVKENLTFFKHLSGYKKKSTKFIFTVEVIIDIFKMTDQADKYSKELSTGYKRCLQIGCALIGNADVLVFDEPTLGMDSDLKHKLWDFLLTTRKEKTIFMSTNCMHEADALGDRIALMHQGRIKCYASPGFLKNAIGTDFKISLRLEKKADIKEIEDIIWDEMEEADINDEKIRIAINLPSHQREHFPQVFEALEKHRKEFGITAMDVGISLEEVFLKFVTTDEDLYPMLQIPEYVFEKQLVGKALRLQQMFWLIKRAWKHVSRHKYQFLFVQVLLPLISCIIVTSASNTNMGFGKSYHEIIKGGGGELSTKVLSNKLTNYRKFNDFDPVSKQFPNLKFVSFQNVYNDTLKVNIIAQQNMKNNLQSTIGIKSANKRTEIFYPMSSGQEDVIKAVNVFSNMYMLRNKDNQTKPGSGKGIHISFEVWTNKKVTRPKNLFLCYSWAKWVTFLVILPLGPFISLCITEYYNGVRFNHLLIGCPPYIIWMSKLIAHTGIYWAVVPCTVVIGPWIFDTDNTINQGDFLVSLFLLVWLYGPAHLLHWYVLSFALSSRLPITKMYITSLCFALITPIFVFSLSEISDDLSRTLVFFLYIIYWAANCMPAFTFSVGMGKITKVARDNALCSLNYDYLCPNDMIDDMWVPKVLCCKSSNGKPYKYLSNFQTGLVELICLLVQCVIYWIILIMLQRRNIQNVFNFEKMASFIFKKKYVLNPQKNPLVKEEEEFVHQKIKLFRILTEKERQQENMVLLADRLFKTYRKNCRKGTRAVKGISFSLKKVVQTIKLNNFHNGSNTELTKKNLLFYTKMHYGTDSTEMYETADFRVGLIITLCECLCLLGQNGAGKTTTLEIVSGYTVMTKGITCVNGYFWNKHRSHYLRNIGWCKVNGFDSFLTGMENIQYLAALIGYPGKVTQTIALRYLDYMGLAEYSETRIQSYSPGCLHRLAMCKVLIGHPRLSFLDEICTAVDPYTRPLITRAVQWMLSQNAACIIAEESISWKEIDEICDRLAIIHKGELVVMGSVSEIRRNWASGYTAIIKLKIDHSYSTVIEEQRQEGGSSALRKSMTETNELTELKAEFAKMFPSSSQMKEHISMIYFHIDDPKQELTYSSMFKNMEILKQKYVTVIEDYILRETSVDELLCRIAKQY